MELHNVVVKEKVVEQLKKILHENYNKEVVLYFSRVSNWKVII